MSISYLRALTDRERNKSANYHLASYLAFIAGATNAGGFLAVHQYTSHMSGIVSSMAGQLVLSQFVLVLDGLGALLSFVTGAACTAILVNWARRKGLKSEYALPLEPIPVGNGLALRSERCGNKARGCSIVIYAKTSNAVDAPL